MKSALLWAWPSLYHLEFVDPSVYAMLHRRDIICAAPLLLIGDRIVAATPFNRSAVKRESRMRPENQIAEYKRDVIRRDDYKAKRKYYSIVGTSWVDWKLSVTISRGLIGSAREVQLTTSIPYRGDAWRHFHEIYDEDGRIPFSPGAPGRGWTISRNAKGEQVRQEEINVTLDYSRLKRYRKKGLSWHLHDKSGQFVGFGIVSYAIEALMQIIEEDN